MADISITVNNYPYTLACDDGEEAQLRQLSAFVENRLESIKQAVGQVGDSRLLLMTALKIADELAEAFVQIEKLEQKIDRTLPETAANYTAEKLAALTKRIETLAEKAKAA